MNVMLDIYEDYKPGSQPPTGYLQWHEWARIQSKAGLKQKKCCQCCLWKFPQELSGKTLVAKGHTSHGQEVIRICPICNECDLKRHLKELS